jgi:hypothetical protein
MPTEAPSYPPCETRFEGRVKGVIKHAKCANAASDHYLVLVRPVDCRRCLGLEREPSANDAPPEPPDLAAPPEPPGLVRRAISYTEALARWTAAGRPERSDKEVERIFHQQCKPCKWYDAERQICRGCGCRVADNGYAVLNKIKMATEACPRNLW